MAVTVVPINIKAIKHAIGNVLPSDFFTFNLYDSEGNLMSTATNDAEGNIEFPTFNLTRIATYHYTIKEEQIEDSEWITDTSEIEVEVIVSEDYPDLKAEINYPNGNTFVNRFISSQTCPSVGYQVVEMCVPVHVNPRVEIGETTTKCCGPAEITPGINHCEGTPLDRCGFTIRQKMCVQVPVDFSVNTDTGQPLMRCQGATTENVCADCDNESE